MAAALKINVSQLEGRFYPDTYLYTANTSDISILKRAHANMNKLVNEIWQGRIYNLPYKKEQDMVTMASIIEKETSVSKERVRVASVFINRLNKGMKLQTDPKVIYGIGDNYNGTLTRKDLETPTYYNTYRSSGRPLGPIAMPGLASLEAAAYPEKTNYFYFVANIKGCHTFNTNLASHTKDMQLYRLEIKAKNEK